MECYTTFKKHKCTVLWYKMQKYYVMQKCWNSMLKNMDIMLKMQKCLHNYMLKGRSVYTCTRNVCTCSRSELYVVIVHRAQDNSYWSERSTATDFFLQQKTAPEDNTHIKFERTGFFLCPTALTSFPLSFSAPSSWACPLRRCACGGRGCSNPFSIWPYRPLWL